MVDFDRPATCSPRASVLVVSRGGRGLLGQGASVQQLHQAHLLLVSHHLVVGVLLDGGAVGVH